MAKNVGQDPDLGDTAQATEQARQTSDPSNYISVSLEKYKDLEGHQADKAALVQQVKYLKKAEKERDQLREENAELVQDRANLWLQVNLLKKDLEHLNEEKVRNKLFSFLSAVLTGVGCSIIASGFGGQQFAWVAGAIFVCGGLCFYAPIFLAKKE